MVTLKIKFGDDTRRVSFNDAGSFGELASLLRELYRIDGQFVVKYEDDDKDYVTITSDQEIREAFNYASTQTSNVLKLTVSTNSQTASSKPADASKETISTEPKGSSNANTSGPSTTSSPPPVTAPFDFVSLLTGFPALAPLLPQVLSNPALTNTLFQLLGDPVIRSNLMALLSNPTICSLVVQLAPQFLANPELLTTVLPFISGAARMGSNWGQNVSSPSPSGTPGNNFMEQFQSILRATNAPAPSPAPSVDTTPKSAPPVQPIDLSDLFGQFGSMYNQFAEQFVSSFTAVPPATTEATAANPEVPKEVPAAPQRNATTDEPLVYVGNLVSDVTVPDGTKLKVNQTFPKIWKIQNDGKTVWPQGTTLVYETGDRLTEADSVEVLSAQPGQSVDVVVHMKAPASPGRYISYWRLVLPNGTSFGQRVWADVAVEAESPSQEQKKPQAAPVESAVPAKPSTPQYSDEVKQLIEMGFERDPVLLQEAVNRNNGDIARVIQEMVDIE